MTHEYRETHLDKVMSLLGEAFDYAINDCKISGDNFVKMFIVSVVSERIEREEPAYISGKSGIELVREIVFSLTGKQETAAPVDKSYRTAEYWCGWAIAYYQWDSGRSFKEIFQIIEFEDLIKLYPTLHEADISKFSELMEDKIKQALPETNLKRVRLLYGYSQKELSEVAGVSLRSIQMYEQRQKDINHASVETVGKLAKALGCSIEDLTEKGRVQ